MAMIVERSMSDDWLSNTYLVAAGPEQRRVPGRRRRPAGAAVREGRRARPQRHPHPAHPPPPRPRRRAGRRADERWPDAEVLAPPRPSASRAPTGDLNPGDELEIGGLTVKALHTPGHTGGMLDLLVDGNELFTGDTLFKGSVGGVRAPGSHDLRGPQALDHGRASSTLPGETVLRPGHTDPSTVADELEHNPFVRIWRGLDARGHRALHGAGRAGHAGAAGATTTTAATRPGCAGRTAATTSSRARQVER